MNLGPTTVSYPGIWSYGRIDGLPISADVSSPFGPRDPIATPVGFTGSYHCGLDLPAPGGTPIYAPTDLTIVAEGPAQNGYGNCVFGVTDDGFQLLFAHMRDGAHAGKGQTVHRGELVGLVGTTGASTGDHLHFGVIQAHQPTISDVNAYVDPALWLNPLPLFMPTAIAPVTIQPKDAALDYLVNILRYFEQNPPSDMAAALRQVAAYVEQLKAAA